MTILGGGEAWFLSFGFIVGGGCLEGMFADRGERHSFIMAASYELDVSRVADPTATALMN